MSKLSLRRLGRTFGSFAAVDDFNLELAAGEFVSLLGPSGCGKTTTLRMIAGFIPPSSGTIEMDGKLLSSPDLTMPPEKRRMSMIFQSYAIWPNMTVAQNVGFGLQVRKLPAAEIARKVDEILEIVHLLQLRERYPAELSGGQQQRVALARAIVVQPDVLLLDEPLSNLDANLREEMRFEIRRLHDAFKITTVYVTHDQAEAMVTSDRIAVMNQGRIEQVDAPFAIYNKPATRFVAGFIGRTNFLEGTRAGDEIGFDGFSVKAGLFDGARHFGTKVVFSIRPQAIALSRQKPAAANGSWWIEGHVTQRAYLGEVWDYAITPRGGSQALRVSAPPSTAVETGDTVWLAIDPADVAHIP